MPQEIRIIEINHFLENVSDYPVEKDITGFVAFAFPGRFVGAGETREEAMNMAKARLRSSRKSYVESGKTIEEWEEWAKKRDPKILELFKKVGLKKNQVWTEEDLKKK